ncbi:MAG: TIGR03016 family PEP-CTERM system-associated outer membrane protein, partial [Thiobacillus sp.]
RLTPSVGGSATYTDNANQSASNPESAVILGVTPGFNLQSEGSRRVQATLQYGLRGVTRFGDDNDSDLYHNLNAIGKAELVEGFLFIDGSARISQELISLLGSPAEADTNDSNRATVGTYSISPYIEKRLGTFADAQARYTASGAIFENDVATASDSTVNAFNAGLTSGTHFNDLTWGLNYSIRQADNRNAADTTFEHVVLDLGYALTRKFRVLGSVGEEWNDYPSLTETSGPAYRLGFGFAPNRRTSIEVLAGERYFGPTYNLSARHRTRSTNWNASYSEDISDTTRLLAASGTLYNFWCPSLPSPLVLDWPFSTPPDASCVPHGNSMGPVFDLRSGAFISKTLRAGVNWQLRKMNYALSVSDSKRLYTSADAEDQTRTVSATAAYRMTPHTTVIGSLNLTRTKVPEQLTILQPTPEPAREDDLVSLSLGVSHQFAEKLNGALTFRHSQRDSNVATSNYDENSIMASVNLRF